jgi:adenylate cyclase
MAAPTRRKLPAVGTTRRWRSAPVLAAGLAAVLVTALQIGRGAGLELPGLDEAERASIDVRFRLRGPRPADPRIAVVGIDDRTRQAAPDLVQTRRGWAHLIDALARYQPKVIALDLFFSSPEQLLRPGLADRVRAADRALRESVEPLPPAAQEGAAVLAAVVDELRGDDVLAQAIGRAGVVYLGASFRLIERRSEVPAEPPDTPAGLERARHGEVVAAGGGLAPPSAYRVDATTAAIARGAAGAGAVNMYADPDGVVRRIPLVIELGGHHYMPLGLAAVLGAEGQPGDTSVVAGARTLAAGERVLPLGSGAAGHVDFLGERPFAHVSAADVLSGAAPREALAGKIVFVGLTYAAYDKVATPFDPLADGVDLHATLADDVLHGRLLVPTGPIAGAGAVALVALLITALQTRRLRRRAWLPPLLALLVLAGWAALAFVAFQRGLLVEVAAPIAGGLIVLGAGVVATLVTEGREKAQLRTVFSQYVSRTLVERLIADPALARLGGERRELTVLFSDIRGFSGFAESLPPEILAGFLNEYLTPMTDLVLGSAGTLDKYIGDAVMAVWGAPIDQADHARRACKTALAMLDALGPLNQRWRAEGLPEITIGIGINTGPMAVGNMGSEARFDYTVLGDAVNLGARLEALTKDYHVAILVGPDTVAAAGDDLVFREIDMVRVKGRDGVARVYELLGEHGSWRARAVDLVGWHRALTTYRTLDFAAAEKEFRACAGRGDNAARMMAERSARLAADPPGPDWDGVYEQHSK